MTNRNQAFRLLDANANRAAEGLRTIEDIARLVCQDRVSTEHIKRLRHLLADAVSQIPRPARLAARHAETDVGTGVTASQEILREDWPGVVTAAAERTTQSLRCLEEFAKLLPNSPSALFKAVRYQAYDILASVELRLRRPQFPAQARLYLLIDCQLPLADFGDYVTRLASQGVDLFQLRDKTADGGKLLEYARRATQALASSDARLIINDRVDIAIAAGASGVHVGQEDLSIGEVRRLVSSDMWVGVSTHSLEQALAAESAGADYIGCGPTFPSTTKQFEAFAGPELLREVAQHVSVPFFAIGGIDQNNLEQVISSGCKRIAVSGAVHAAAQPGQAAKSLAKVLAEAES